MPTISDLPNDVLRLVAQRLNHKDLRSLAATSRRLQKVALSAQGDALRNTVREIEELSIHMEERRRQVGAATDALVETLQRAQALASKAKKVDDQTFKKMVAGLVKELVGLTEDLKALKKLAWEKSVELTKVQKYWNKVRAERRTEPDDEFRKNVGTDRKTVEDLLKRIAILDSSLKQFCDALEGEVGAIQGTSSGLAKALAKK